MLKTNSFVGKEVSTRKRNARSTRS